MSDDTEEWRHIPGFERYQASSFGRIRNTECRWKRPALTPWVARTRGKETYYRVELWLDKKPVTRQFVHRLVWLAFCGQPPPGMQINHIDGDKLNNRLTNLECVTPRENVLHAIRTGLVPPVIAQSVKSQICEDASRLISTKLAKKYGVSLETARRITKDLPARKKRQTLTAKDYEDIKAARAAGVLVREVAERWGISRGRVSHIVHDTEFKRRGRKKTKKPAAA